MNISMNHRYPRGSSHCYDMDDLTYSELRLPASHAYQDGDDAPQVIERSPNRVKASRYAREIRVRTTAPSGLEVSTQLNGNLFLHKRIFIELRKDIRGLRHSFANATRSLVQKHMSYRAQDSKVNFKYKSNGDRLTSACYDRKLPDRPANIERQEESGAGPAASNRFRLTDAAYTTPLNSIGVVNRSRTNLIAALKPTRKLLSWERSGQCMRLIKQAGGAREYIAEGGSLRYIQTLTTIVE